MAFAFLFQLRIHGGAMFAVQWWPILITGVLFISTCCLDTFIPSEICPQFQHRKQFYFMKRLPSVFVLKCSSLISFGLSPFWAWQNSPANLSYRLDHYFTCMLALAAVAMFVMVVSFARHLRVLAVYIGGSDGFVRRMSFAVRGWLYFFLVPIFAVIAGSNRIWRDMLANTDFTLDLVVRMIKFQVMMVFGSWIGTMIIWCGLGMLAWDVLMAMEMLFHFNHFSKENEQVGRITTPRTEDDDVSLEDGGMSQETNDITPDDLTQLSDTEFKQEDSHE